jgi:hypothetical protein
VTQPPGPGRLSYAARVRHAGDRALDQLEPLLRDIRTLEGLSERKRGTFYRRGSAFLHFHEDPTGLFADIKVAGEWSRLPATTADEQRLLLEAAVRTLNT